MDKFDVKISDKKFSALFMLLALIISSILLFTSSPYYGHDIGFHLSRIQSIADCLSQGTFPALIYPGYFDGYGYANGLFYPDFFLYLPGILVWLGIPCKISYQIFLFLINVSTMISMYFCINRIIRNGYVSSVVSCLYLLSSYRLTDLYTRSALGETLCFIFVPFIMLGVYEIFFEDPKKGYFILIGLFGVLSSHIITLVSCAIFIIIAYLVRLFSLLKDRKKWIEQTGSVFLWCLLSIGVCAYFLFPFLEAYLSDTFLFQTAPATGGYDRAMPFLLSLIEIPTYRLPYVPLGIGIVFIILSVLYLILKIRHRYDDKTADLFLILGAVFLVISTDLFPWSFFKGFAKLIQFPWRFLIIATNAFLFGFAPVLRELMKENRQKFRYTLLMIAAAGFTVLCFAVDIYIINDLHFYDEEVHYSVGGAEYLPSDVDTEKLNGQIILNHDIETEYTKKGTSIKLSYSNNTYEDSYAEVPLIYYKGYKASDGNGPLAVSKGDNGLVRIRLEQPQATVDLHYGLTPLRIAGYAVSLLSLIIFVYLIRKA